jgi:solute carrier family 34 (sodium-dependent phosphate cotransporter)
MNFPHGLEKKIAESAVESASKGSSTHLVAWAGVAFLIYSLVVAVGLIGTGFKLSAGSQAKELFDFATNPFLGLMVGIICTALIQSSSTVTSIIVGLVAGGLPVTVAVPMVMGANIGTSVTNTLVSLTCIGRPDEFRRAFAAATVLDMFNLFAVLIFFPLEMLFHPLERVSLATSSWLIGDSPMNMASFNFVSALTAPVSATVTGLTGFLPGIFSGLSQIAIGIVVVFFSIFFLGKLLKTLMVGKARTILETAIGRGPMTGIFSGVAMTVLVQSSSTTTSLMVPLAASGVLSLRAIYPFTLGANIGTCVTALLAATGVSGADSLQALEIALVHLLFNTFGVLILFGLPLLRGLPLAAAEWLAQAAVKNRWVVLVYVMGVFFVIPGLLLGVTSLL